MRASSRIWSTMKSTLHITVMSPGTTTRSREDPLTTLFPTTFNNSTSKLQRTLRGFKFPWLKSKTVNATLRSGCPSPSLTLNKSQSASRKSTTNTSVNLRLSRTDGANLAHSSTRIVKWELAMTCLDILSALRLTRRRCLPTMLSLWLCWSHSSDYWGSGYLKFLNLCYYTLN